MSFEAWIIFVSFWALFVTTPGPNALNCITVALHYGFNTALFLRAGDTDTSIVVSNPFGIWHHRAHRRLPFGI